MTTDLCYSAETYTAEIEAAPYIAGFHDGQRFIKLCRQCSNYGKRHGCPPFEFNPLDILKKYRNVKITGIKITPDNNDIPIERANELMQPAIGKLNEDLLAEEKALSGLSLGFVGACPYCGGQPCARTQGKPCRHPQKVRPSLEAFGFDVAKTAKELLGLEIKWGKNGKMPEYLTLVCATFH